MSIFLQFQLAVLLSPAIDGKFTVVNASISLSCQTLDGAGITALPVQSTGLHWFESGVLPPGE